MKEEKLIRGCLEAPVHHSCPSGGGDEAREKRLWGGTNTMTLRINVTGL